ncbi:MAG: hypothetical protein K5650_02320 [Bacteroidales bacterium]|nr:hypothetical protein [Bacteroidales bacterium]
MKKTVLIMLMIATTIVGNAQIAIGHWRDHLPYSSVKHVQAASDGRIYASASMGMFYYDPSDNTVVRMNKTTGMSDAGIATFAHDATTKTLVVAYSNSNIDLVVDDRTYNISDIKRNDNLGDKTIHAIRFHNRKAYVACGFGIVVIDLNRKEIKETYHIGNGGAYTAVYDIAFCSDSIYAATAEGLKRAPATNRFLTISDLWLPVTDTSLASSTITMLDTINNKIVAAAYTNDPEQLTLYTRNVAESFVPFVTGNIVSIRSSNRGLLVALNDRIDTYSRALQHTDSLTSWYYGGLEIQDADFATDGGYWIGHPWGGLLYCSAYGSGSYFPNGPVAGEGAYRLMPYDNTMMFCPGGKATTYAKLYLPANLLTFKDEKWIQLDKSNGLIDTASDVLDAVVNPFDSTETIAAMWGIGVAQIKDNQVVTVYNEANTGGALKPISNNALLTGALAFDDKGNLWVTCSGQNQALAVRHPDGSWQGLSTAVLGSTLDVDKIIWDSITDYKWFAGRSNAIYVHDGTGKMAVVNPNNGSKLRTESVNCMAQDQNGDIWIGTNKGIKVIYDGRKAFDGGGNGEQAPVTCSNITITGGEFYEYLMAYENITCIAVDGANRKWVGTASGGLYLLSANGLNQLEHFTAANSPMFSDKVLSLAVQPRSGEVFVGTDRGLLSYRSTATYGDVIPQNSVYAFPNPVRPGYTGPIAIKGLTRGAIVHITDAAGHTVFSAEATGGQVVWNGRTLSGDLVASGVYYAFASNLAGTEKSVAKILIIR